MAGKKNPNLGDKLRQEREGAENTLRDSRSKTADSSTGDGGKKKAEHRRQIRHEADLAKMRSKKLKSEQEVKAKKNAAASGKKGGKPKKPGNLAADALSAKAHQSVRNADQDNNSGVEAAHFTEGSAEGAARAGSRFQYGRKLRQYKKLERLEKKANKDAVDSIFAERMKSDPQAGSNFFSRWRQKQAIKKEYAAAKAGAAAAENTAAGTAKAAQGTASMTEKAFQFVQSHSHIIIGIAAVGLLVLVIAGSVSSCSVLINGGGNVVLGTSYTAEDEDLKGVETDYTKLEDKLRKQIDRIETDHPGYDEYRYNLAEIGHNPYELASLLTVEFENYTRSQVQARLQSIFEAQYELKLEEKVGELLKAKKLSLSTAESCTGGGIAALITSVPGSSEYFNGSIVAYSNEIKMSLLHVSAETLEKHGAVSRETVTEMVKGAMKTLKTDCAVATSGIAGPGGGTPEKPVGTVWIAAAYKNEIVTMKQEGDEGRKGNVEKAIQNALLLLCEKLK